MVMSIPIHYDGVKKFFKAYESEVVLATGVVLISIISFGLGRLSIEHPKSPPLRIEEGSLESAALLPGVQSSREKGNDKGVAVQAGGTRIVASRNGTRYYFPWCSGLNRIKEENKIFFNSEKEAQGAGYTLAANCDGL